MSLRYSLVDENLTWHSLINKLTQKIASGNGAMKRIRPFVPPATLIASSVPWYNPSSITVV